MYYLEKEKYLKLLWYTQLDKLFFKSKICLIFWNIIKFLNFYLNNDIYSDAILNKVKLIILNTANYNYII